MSFSDLLNQLDEAGELCAEAAKTIRLIHEDRKRAYRAWQDAGYQIESLQNKERAAFMAGWEDGLCGGHEDAEQAWWLYHDRKQP